jgi:hypothetical protein
MGMNLYQISFQSFSSCVRISPAILELQQEKRNRMNSYEREESSKCLKKGKEGHEEEKENINEEAVRKGVCRNKYLIIRSQISRNYSFP